MKIYDDPGTVATTQLAGWGAFRGEFIKTVFSLEVGPVLGAIGNSSVTSLVVML